MKKSMKTLLLILVFLYSGTFAIGQTKKTTEIVKIKTSAQCGMCKDRIEQNLAYEKGVSDVSLDLTSKVVTVKYKSSKTNPDQIRQALSKIGYDADQVKADPKAYKALPACCKKPDDPAHSKH